MNPLPSVLHFSYVQALSSYIATNKYLEGYKPKRENIL